MSTKTKSNGQAAADAAAKLVPAAAALVAVPAASAPPEDAKAVVAGLVGATSVEMSLIAADAVVEVIAASAAEGTAIELADALRPALEAAAQAWGPGVLEPSRVEQVGRVIGADTEVFALQSEGVDIAWFTVRVRAVPKSQPASASSSAVPQQKASIRVLYDVEMTLTAELGRTRLPLRQVLELSPGAVLELDRTAGSPADVLVNGRLVARGEVVVVDEDYGLRITEIVSDGQS